MHLVAVAGSVTALSHRASQVTGPASSASPTSRSSCEPASSDSPTSRSSSEPGSAAVAGSVADAGVHSPLT